MTAEHAHAHSHSHSHVDPQHAHVRPLVLTLVLTCTLLIVEAVTGWLVHSLALLADSAHMLTDVTALAISLTAIRVGRRPADARRTFGYRRFEVIAAAGNALLLFAAAITIFVEAIQRLLHPPPIDSGPMMIVAVVGLVVNAGGIFLLRKGQGENLNMHGAYLEVLSDALGSIGVIAAAVVIRFTGWRPIDPILAVLIGLWVLPRTWRLLNKSVHVLLEGTPEGVDVRALHHELARLPGVVEVHDLHIWSLSSGQNSLTAHLVVETPDLDLVRLAQAVARRHEINHATIQLEDPETQATERQIHHAGG